MSSNTGTLTCGRLDVTRYVSTRNDEKERIGDLELVYALEIGSNHVLANAIRKYVEKISNTQRTCLNVVSRLEKVGFGVCGVVELNTTRQYRVHIGSSAFLRDEGVNIDLDDDIDEMNCFVAVNKVLVGQFMFRETPRPECKDVIQRLQNRNIRVAVLTGDRRRSARKHFEAAMHTNLDEWHVCLPHEKADHIRKWQKQGHVVAMVGDGVNDAAAMVCADVGVGIGTDAFVTGCADITIVGDKFDRNVRSIRATLNHS